MEGKKLITATDTQYSGSLLQSLNDQRLQGLYCDVTVIVEDRKFRAHKNILSACSTYFHQLFIVAGPVVELNFIRAEIFAEILNYIYSAKIVRLKCDMLEELIKSGKLLGVPFIADLGIPLSQVKNMAGGPKDGPAEGQSNSDPKSRESTKNTSGHSAKAVGESDMPVIGETFSLSFSRESKTDTDFQVIESDDDDDVIFCSETVQAKPVTPEKKESVQTPTPTSDEQASDTKKATPSSQSQQPNQNTKPLTQPPLKNMGSASSNTEAKQSTQDPPNGSVVPPAPQPVPVTAPPPAQTSQTASSSVTAISAQKQTPTDANQNLPKLQPIGIIQPKTELILDGNSISNSPVSTAVSLEQPPTITHKNVSFDGVQKKQVVTFSPGSSSKPGEFKIKIADVVSGSSKDSSESRRILDGKKIITLDTASEIEGLSTGCKVYANIGEDTYDIVIPIKDDPEEGLPKLEDDDDDSPNRKRMKLKHDDHYELIVDGRVYYICIVCKRSYVCLTSLRRHFNVHSWEKKYPCRYCERVFPLAEYRTKHEIHHTGERRYQCLTCGSSFINYQVMASHIRSVHSMDPAGDSKLYRLNPCKTLQIRQYAYISESSNAVPVINDGGIVYDIDPDKSEPASAENHSGDGPKPVNWDDIFIQQSNQNMFKPTTPEGSTEFEFVIPESY
ncbi:transcriptional regulator Kaiso isoform X2 [Hyla sarda]|nr:transcriptional regulator Kaiso isoform X2 [Hyla sarda]XP_056394717.1 transcriptional regulator Kaiso isoform X2 [Hyla sarda]XP_056394718.1 transcriptional regulator Kaiso isoform X2 [Hyla sarda]XP_056394719.1 transcriptional regulator Kaiso isoform X2 [Hyla sarda]XP_056394720.1 transcriptional regulator Kaiso isoform X2 [Hyla sarda]